MEYLYFFDQSTGACTSNPGSWLIPTKELVEAQTRPNVGDVAWWSEEDLGADITLLSALFDAQGAVESVQVDVPTPPINRYVEVNISGNSSLAFDGTKTFVPGDVVAIAMTLKTGPEPDAPTWKISTPVGITLSVAYRKNGVFAGRLRCAFVKGVCTFNLPVTEAMHGDISIKQADITPFELGGEKNLVVLTNEVAISVEKASS